MCIVPAGADKLLVDLGCKWMQLDRLACLLLLLLVLLSSFLLITVLALLTATRH